MPHCQECGTVLDGIIALKLHLRLIHKKDTKRSTYTCGEPSCFKHCSNWIMFRKHLVGKHKFTAGERFSSNGVSVQSSDVSKESIPHSDLPDQDLGERDCYREADRDCSLLQRDPLDSNVDSMASILIAKLYSNPRLPRNHVQKFVEDTSDFLSCALSAVQEQIKLRLMQNNTDPAVTDSVCSTLNTVKEPFRNLLTEHKRMKYMKDKGYYIEPLDYGIASTLHSKKQGDKVVVEIDKVTAKFVPLREVLKKFLEMPGVFDVIAEVLESKPPAGIISHFIHGLHWQMKKQFFSGKFTIPLLIFYDDFEPDKELGNHSAKQGAVYVKIACMPSEFQGTLENIFLALLFNSADRVDFGTGKVFRKLVDQLYYLQSEGIDIYIKDRNCNQKVYFSLGLLLGDNLGLHTMLGFSESFSCNHPCRMCHVHKSVMHTQCFEDPRLLRDEVQHTEDLKTCDVSESGVKQSSPFDKLDHFHVTSNPAVDLMHDVFEGVLPYDFRHILYQLVFVKKYFDVDSLNFRMLTYTYGPEISNKVSRFSENTIKSCKSLKMTASEMLTFSRIFALLVGDLVPEEDDIWSLYLLLRDIIDILLCSSVEEEICIVLNRKIGQHHKLYVHLFNDNLKPKHHYLLHYARIMKQSGCVANFSCLRFEAKHQPFIQSAKATNSRRNISHTLAVKSQLSLAYKFMSGRGLVTQFELGPEGNCTSFHRKVLPLSFQREYVEHQYVNYKGTEYKPEMCVVVGEDEGGGPIFGIISSVLLIVRYVLCTSA